MWPYGLHSHVVKDDIYDYKPSYGCNHIYHALAQC
jgi:hypothetical protein